MSTSVAAGIDGLPCFIAIDFYQIYKISYFSLCLLFEMSTPTNIITCVALSQTALKYHQCASRVGRLGFLPLCLPL